MVNLFFLTIRESASEPERNARIPDTTTVKSYVLEVSLPNAHVTLSTLVFLFSENDEESSYENDDGRDTDNVFKRCLYEVLLAGPNEVSKLSGDKLCFDITHWSCWLLP